MFHLDRGDGGGRPPPSLVRLSAVPPDPVNILIRTAQPFQKTLVIFGMTRFEQMVPHLHFLIVKPYLPKHGNPCLDIHVLRHHLPPVVL